MSGFRKPKDLASAQRMRALRAYLGYAKAKDFAEFLGVSPGSYVHLENGKPISKRIAFALCRKIPGMTLDWVWFGRSDKLPHRFAIELERFMAQRARVISGERATLPVTALPSRGAPVRTTELADKQ